MKIRKYLWLLPLVALAVVGCTVADTGDDEPETLEPGDPSTSDDPNTGEEPNTGDETTDPTDPEVVRYDVTVSADEGAEVVGLEESYEAGATVTFTVNLEDSRTKAVGEVAWNTNNVIEADAEGVYSFTMPAENVVITVTVTEAPTPWSDVLGANNVSIIDASLNVQDEEGTLSFDYDVPFADVGWSVSNASVSASSINLYVTTSTQADVIDKYNTYKEAIEDAGYTVVEDSYTLVAENADETIILEFGAYSSGTGTYLIDLYVYSDVGTYGNLLTAIFGSDWILTNEGYFNLTVDEVSAKFPFVNNPYGYSGGVYGSANGVYYWALVMIYLSTTTNLSTYTNILYSYINPVYTALGWEAATGTYGYTWSKTEDGVTYTLELQRSSISSYYGPVLLFETSTAAEAEE